MNRSIALIITLCLSGSSLLAQDTEEMPGPPAELAKYDRLIGTWQGSGTATMAPGETEIPWTSKSEVKKVLSEYFLEEITVIDFGPGMPAQLVFRSFMGYDTQTGRYMTCGVSNMGLAKTSEIHWADENTMVTLESAVEEGNFVVDRWVTTLGTDSYSFAGHRAIGGGDFFVHVEGKLTRTDESFERPNFETAPALAPVGSEMQKLNRMAGRYRLTGKFQMMPDTPAMDISGVEDMTPIFGGSALQAKVVGDPIPGMGTYEAWAAFAWDGSNDCYTSIYVNNMGEIAKGEARWIGDRLVSFSSQLRMGQPSAARGIITFDENGAIATVVSNSMIGDHAPAQDFEGTYTLRQD